MGYYQGDWYAGSQGDPGFFSFLGNIAKAAVGFIPGVGPIASKALSVIPRAGVSQAIERVGGQAITLTGRAGRLMRAYPKTAIAGGTAAAAGAAYLMRRRAGGRGAPGMAGMRRRRRMNVYNPKALRRAVRRATGFARMARRVLRFVSPKAPRGRAVFRVRRKKKVC